MDVDQGSSAGAAAVAALVGDGDGGPAGELGGGKRSQHTGGVAEGHLPAGGGGGGAVEEQVAGGLLHKRAVPVEKDRIHAGDGVDLAELPAQQGTEGAGAVGQVVGGDGAKAAQDHQAVLADPTGQQGRGEVGDVLAGLRRDEQPEGHQLGAHGHHPKHRSAGETASPQWTRDGGRPRGRSRCGSGRRASRECARRGSARCGGTRTGQRRCRGWNDPGRPGARPGARWG